MLELRRGDTNPINIICQRPMIDANGDPLTDARGRPQYEPVDLTGATLTFQAWDRKKNLLVTLDSDPGGGLGGIVFQNPPTAGTATATVQPSVTVNWTTPLYLRYEVVLIESDGTRTTVAADEAVVKE